MATIKRSVAPRQVRRKTKALKDAARSAYETARTAKPKAYAATAGTARILLVLWKAERGDKDAATLLAKWERDALPIALPDEYALRGPAVPLPVRTDRRQTVNRPEAVKQLLRSATELVEQVAVSIQEDSFETIVAKKRTAPGFIAETMLSAVTTYLPGMKMDMRRFGVNLLVLPGRKDQNAKKVLAHAIVVRSLVACGISDGDARNWLKGVRR